MNTLFLYQCPSRRLAGRLCAQILRRRRRAVLQLYQGNWVVISLPGEPELLDLPCLLARYGAIAIRVEAQTHQLLLSGVKRPQREEPACSLEQDRLSCLMESRRRRKHKQRWFSPFLKKP